VIRSEVTRNITVLVDGCRQYHSCSEAQIQIGEASLGDSSSSPVPILGKFTIDADLA